MTTRGRVGPLRARRRQLLLLIIAAQLLIVYALLASCGAGSPAHPTPKRIAVVISTLNNPWFVVLAEAARTEAEQRGYQTTVFDSQNDPAKEAANVENIVASHFDAMLLNATDSSGSVANAARARSANIPVFTIDREINSTTAAVSQILSDNYSAAVALGVYFASQVGTEGEYAEILGTVTDANTWNRSDGFHSVVDRYPGLHMIAQQSAEFDRSRALEVMEAILQAHPRLSAVFCGNDSMALGAYQVLLAHGQANRVKVFGFDGSTDALREIGNGMSATVMQFPKVMASTAVDFADRYLKGARELPGKVLVAADLVTARNVGDFANYGRRDAP